MCVLQSIASNSQREFNLSAADTPVPHSGRILVKDALIATTLRKPFTRQRQSVLHSHTGITGLPFPLDPIIIQLELLSREEKKSGKYILMYIYINYELPFLAKKDKKSPPGEPSQLPPVGLLLHG